MPGNGDGWWSATPEGEEVSQDIWPDDVEVPDVCLDEVRSAAGVFKSRTSCPCGLHPRHFGMLSDGLTRLIARQWTLWERYGQVPRAKRQLVVTLTPKPDGGLRPIALFRGAYWVLARVNVKRLQDWASRLDCCAINTVAGRQVSDTRWRTLADKDIEAAECEEASEAFCVEVDQDVRTLLARKAIKEGMPLSVIGFSLASYAWARRLQYNGVFSDVLMSTRGIGAGAAPATFELVGYVIEDIRVLSFARELPEVQVATSLRVDDLTLTVKGESKRAVVQAAVICVRKSWRTFIAKLGLPFATKKMFIVASSEDLAKDTAKSLKVPVSVVQKEIRRLGVDYSLQARRKHVMAVARSREARHRARWALLKSFRKVARGPLIFLVVSHQGHCTAPTAKGQRNPFSGNCRPNGRTVRMLDRLGYRRACGSLPRSLKQTLSSRAVWRDFSDMPGRCG